MACVTSYFNSTLWRKTMHRFWPLWAAYGVFWLFLQPLSLLTNYFGSLPYITLSAAQQDLLRSALRIPDMLQGGVWFSAGFGLLSAMAVFGYLYNNRSAAMMHALPMRRDTLFFTQYVAGVSYFLLPYLVTALLTAAAELALLPSADWGKALGALGVWLLTQTATSLFFFSFAAFCAMFTGHVLALPAFYGILNCLVVAIYSLCVELARHFFFGMSYYSMEHPLVILCTPVYALTEACNWRMQYEDVLVGGVYDSQLVDCYLMSPGTVAGYAVAGIVFALLALMVYRRRHVESAGDVVSVPVVRPIFRAGVAFCAGLCFGVFTAAFFSWMDIVPLFVGCILLWTAVGWFAAEMLLKKSFRVLRCWKGCLVMLCAMALLCAACIFDWFGVENRVPQAGGVTSLTVSVDMGAPGDDGAYLDAVFTDPQDIQTFLAIHQAVVNDKARLSGSRSGDEYISNLSLTYQLENGSTLRRQYYSLGIYKDEVAQPGSLTQLMDALCRDRDMVRLAYGMDDLSGGKVVRARLYNLYDELEEGHTRLDLDSVSQIELQQLWQAVQQDFSEGTLGVRYLFEDEERSTNTYYTDLRLYFELPKRDEKPHVAQTYEVLDSGAVVSGSLNITLTPNAHNTLNWIRSSGVLGDKYQIAAHIYTPEDMQEAWLKYGEYYSLDSIPVELP